MHKHFTKRNHNGGEKTNMPTPGPKGRSWTPEEKAAAKLRYWKRMAEKDPKYQAKLDEILAEKPLEGQLDIEEEVAKTQESEPLQEQEPEHTTVASETSQSELLNRTLEAIALLAEASGNKAQGPRIENGKLTGTMDRFPVDSTLYEDFTPRLAADPTLARFGFKENYWLDYKFEVVRYQTIDNIWMQEPKITIDLNRRQFDEQTGEPTGGAFKMYRIVIHEDPDTAVYIARLNGINVPDDPAGERAFLNEMRFLQVRDWLRECFMPKKPTGHNNKREMVINGRLVEYFEVNSENAQSLPFGELNTRF